MAVAAVATAKFITALLLTWFRLVAKYGGGEVQLEVEEDLKMLLESNYYFVSIAN